MEKNKIKSKSKNKNLNPVVIILFIILVLYALTFFFLLGWGLLTSLKSYYDFEKLNNVLGLPNIAESKKYYETLALAGKDYGPYHIFKNYEHIISSFSMTIKPQGYYSSIFGEIADGEVFTATLPIFLLNSLLYAFLGAGLFSFCCMTTAYLCAKYKYKFSTFLYTLIIVMMTVPLIGASAATVSILKTMGIYDTYFSMLFMNCTVGGLYFLVYFAFFQGLSDTYIEAAKMDGASQLKTYFFIVIPLAAKTFGTIFLLQFIALWNNYEAPLLYYPSEPTLAYAIYKMTRTTGQADASTTTQGEAQRIAGCMILALPVTILFLCFNRVILGSLTMGGIKE